MIHRLPRYALIGFLCLSASLATAGQSVSTKHYDIYSEGMDAKEMGVMLEQLYNHLHKFFDSEPKQRLSVHIYANHKAYMAAQKHDNGWASNSGGFFAWKNKRVYLYVQPSEYYTRQLILHEATHQFHHLTRAKGKKPTGYWYIEGIAEYFGMHNWDGKTLQTGVVPAITLEDYPADALALFGKVGGDMMAMMNGKAKSLGKRRELPWAWIHFLHHTYPDKFRRLTALLDQQTPMSKAWEATFKQPATPQSPIVKQFKAYLEKHQQPWKWVWNAWQERGCKLRGHSNVNALAVLKITPTAFGAIVTPKDKQCKAGLVFGYQNPKHFYLLQMTSPTQVCIIQFANGRWYTRLKQTVPLRKNGILLALQIRGKKVFPVVNGKTLAAQQAPGQVGLNVDRCTADFQIKIKTQPARQ